MGLPKWLIGVFFSLVGSTVLNVGVNTQKFSHNANERLPLAMRRPYWKQRRWLLGFALFLLGNVGDFIALGMASPSIITPLGSVSLISNSIIAYKFLGETYTRRDLLATIVIIAGATVAVLFGAHSSPVLTLDTLLGYYTNGLFLAYIGLVGGLVTALFLTARRLRVVVAQYTDGATGDADMVGATSAVPALKYLPLIYASIGGLIGSMTVITAKACSGLLQTSILEKKNQFTSPLAFLIVAAFAFSSASQIHWLNVGLRSADSLFIVPTFYVVWTSFSIIGGLIYYHELGSFHAAQYFLFPMGVLTTFAGVYLLTSRLRAAPSIDVTDDGEELQLAELGPTDRSPLDIDDDDDDEEDGLDEDGGVSIRRISDADVDVPFAHERIPPRGAYAPV